MMPKGLPGPLLKQAIRHPRITRALTRAATLHREVEEEFRERLDCGCNAVLGLEFPHLDLSGAEYWQRNFFSILFLSILESIGVERDRLVRYGLAMHAVRGIVTATDNMLDSEDKGALHVRGMGGPVLDNVMSVLLQDGIMHQTIAELAPDRTAHRRTWHKLMCALAEVGREESKEEQDITDVLPPAELIHRVHGYRGGRLLQLAFVLPTELEPDQAGTMPGVCAGVHRIGLGLQALDDVTDLALDVRKRNHNLLRSWIVHVAPDGVAAPTPEPDTPGIANPTETYPTATAQVVALAVQMALDGFERLHKAGYIIKPKTARSMMATMAALRNLGAMWEFYENSGADKADEVRQVLAEVEKMAGG